MIEALLVVLTNAVAGRDEDFNDWYTHIHTRDALRCRGSIAQQRFRFAQEQVQDFPDGYMARYLALYEVYDAERFVQEHIDQAATPRMEVENSIDTSRINDFHYYPLQFRDKAPRTFQDGSVVLEQMKAKPGQEAALREWYHNIYLPARFRQQGIITASFLAFDPYGQMLPYPPAHDHLGIWRLADDSARDLWRRDDVLRQCPFVEDTVAVTCWDVQTQRVTEDDVFNSTPEAAAGEEKARQRIHAQDTLIRPGSTPRSLRS